MKKILAGALCLLMLFGGFSGIRAGAEGQPVRVIVTIFPVWDWTREVAGGDADMELTLLLDDGIDMHSYQPSMADMMKIASCDVFIYAGGESDAWAADALAQAVNPDMIVVNLLEVLGDRVRMEETVEGMEPGDDEEEEAADEHIWLSLRNAEVLTEAIAEALAKANPGGAERYRGNAESYIARLRELDARYTETVEKAAYRTLVFADRFPFRYLTEDYGLDYYAAFSGCSAETEASFQTVLFLIGKVDELGLPAVIRIDGGDGRIAQTVISGTQAKNQAMVTLDSMQGVTDADIEGGKTYLSAMEENLKALAEALDAR